MAAVRAQEAGETSAQETADGLYALSAVLMDADNGRVLLQKNGTQVLPMASTTKIMTCILALELADGRSMPKCPPMRQACRRFIWGQGRDRCSA